MGSLIYKIVRGVTLWEKCLTLVIKSVNENSYKKLELYIYVVANGNSLFFA